MKRSVILCSLLLLSACNSDSNSDSNPPSTQDLQPGGYMYFFEHGVPATLSSPNKLSINSEHYKDGGHSLQWDFTGENKLVFDQEINYTEEDSSITPYTFMAWIYNETPLKTKALFQFSTDDKKNASFIYSLDFKGWRGIAVPFRDMRGTPVSGMNRLSISVGKGKISGTLLLDQVMLAVPVDHRWPTPDYQQPFVNPEVETMISKNWSALLMYDRMIDKEYPSFDFDSSFDDTQGDSEVLYTNFDTHLGVNESKTISQKEIDSNLEEYAPFEIVINADNSVTGVPLDAPKRQVFYQADLLDESTLTMLNNTMYLKALGKVMLKTAIYLRSTSLSDVESKQLETTFINATRYALDQGWQVGSGFQIITHVGYETRDIFNAFFVARNLLAEHDLLEQVQQSMMWFNATGRIFEDDSEIISADVDILNTQLQWMIKSILLLPNEPDRDKMLMQLQSWLSKTLIRSNGLTGGFKVDGSIFHHSQHYTAYGNDAFKGLSGAIYGLSDSSYQISEAAHKRINGALLKMRIYTQETHTPIVLSGRHPDDKQKITTSNFKWLALAGSPDGSEPIDKVLAGAYANLTDVDSFEGIPATPVPTGVWVMNYASMLVARGVEQGEGNKPWLAVARGFSRYLVGNEAYQKNNLYGRYVQYGQLEIVPSDYKLHAFSHDGWDWNRYPGTTTIHLENTLLRATLNQLPDAGIEEMLLSTETYSGANSLGSDAMFAVKLHGHKKYGQQSFYANKSYFIFDNLVIALGSNITDTDTVHATETTLFQINTQVSQNFEVNGELENNLGTKKTFADRDVTFLDPAGNRYFVPQMQGNTIKYLFQKQSSNHEKNGSVTSGTFATAYIDHGFSPTNKGYEYAIKIEAKSDKTKPDYVCLIRTENVHAVRSNKGVEAYAFFNKVSNLNIENAYLVGAETASQIMLKATGNDLLISVVNPDLALYSGVDDDQVDSDGNQIEVSIYSRPWLAKLSQAKNNIFDVKGKWTLKLVEASADVNVTITGNVTHIEVSTIDAVPAKFTLMKS